MPLHAHTYTHTHTSYTRRGSTVSDKGLPSNPETCAYRARSILEVINKLVKYGKRITEEAYLPVLAYASVFPPEDPSYQDVRDAISGMMTKKARGGKQGGEGGRGGGAGVAEGKGEEIVMEYLNKIRVTDVHVRAHQEIQENVQSMTR